VWSFGITVFEIYSNGEQPYAGFSNAEIMGAVQSGGRVAQPTRCPMEMYEVLLSCWCAEPDERPTFTELAETISNLNLPPTLTYEGDGSGDDIAALPENSKTGSKYPRKQANASVDGSALSADEARRQSFEQYIALTKATGRRENSASGSADDSNWGTSTGNTNSHLSVQAQGTVGAEENAYTQIVGVGGAGYNSAQNDGAKPPAVVDNGYVQVSSGSEKDDPAGKIGKQFKGRHNDTTTQPSSGEYLQVIPAKPPRGSPSGEEFGFGFTDDEADE
jgi:hypothetical protein